MTIEDQCNKAKARLAESLARSAGQHRRHIRDAFGRALYELIPSSPGIGPEEARRNVAKKMAKK